MQSSGRALESYVSAKERELEELARVYASGKHNGSYVVLYAQMRRIEEQLGGKAGAHNRVRERIDQAVFDRELEEERF